MPSRTSRSVRRLVPSSLVFALAALPARAQLTALSSFNPSNTGGLCGIGLDPVTGDTWVYGCTQGTIQQYTPAGVFVSEVPRPGEAANDVDVEFSPEVMLVGGTSVPEGTLLFINGESGTAEIYAVDKASGAVISTLSTAFGVSHVVGGAYHRARDTWFLVQDGVPGAAGNVVAEVDPQTGAVLQSFSTSAAGFSVNFGDLEVTATGNLAVVSSAESTVALFSPTGVLLTELALPAGVTSLSGIALTSGTQGWVASTGGVVTRLDGFPLCLVSSYCTPGTSTNGCTATIGSSGTPSASAGSGFTIQVTGVEGAKSGLIFYGISGSLASPWGTGSTSFLCVKSPTQRLPTLSSGGNAGACDGSFAFDWNLFVATNPSSLGSPFAGGETVHAQAWYRDPPAPKTTNLSDGLTYVVCP